LHVFLIITLIQIILLKLFFSEHTPTQHMIFYSSSLEGQEFDTHQKKKKQVYVYI